MRELLFPAIRASCRQRRPQFLYAILPRARCNAGKNGTVYSPGSPNGSLIKAGWKNGFMHDDGLALKAQRLAFRPQRLRGGEFHFEVGTAGSITLVLQALLPAIIRSVEPLRVSISGGTDVRAAPPLDYFRQVLLARGESMFTARMLSSHAQTTMWLIEQFLPVRFEAASCGAAVSVTVRPT